MYLIHLLDFANRLPFVILPFLSNQTGSYHYPSRTFPYRHQSHQSWRRLLIIARKNHISLTLTSVTFTYIAWPSILQYRVDKKASFVPPLYLLSHEKLLQWIVVSIVQFFFEETKPQILVAEERITRSEVIIFLVYSQHFRRDKLPLFMPGQDWIKEMKTLISLNAKIVV